MSDTASATVEAPAPATAPALAFAKLAALSPSLPLDAGELAAVLDVHRATVWRAARRGELPAPFRLMGREVWTVQALLDHFGKLQKAALK